ncbi:thioredoxin [Fictibacillus nanhaiensis]|uniref:thioredoxin n=1 Tax=Fictibacillus nanhaiensis TaxID=742169 RepID=UPI002E1D74F3|nr:thioredoxin [Fictibacillus nanhaiensis]
MKLIKFEKQNCPACTMVENFLSDQGVETKKINPFDNPDLAAQYEIGSVPVTILLNEEGTEVERSIGFKPHELERIISKL